MAAARRAGPLSLGSRCATGPIVDDGAYGLLREFGVSAPFGRSFGPTSDMINSLAEDGPRAVAPPAVFRMSAPTHQEVQWRTT
jgi:hypothetical protein